MNAYQIHTRAFPTVCKDICLAAILHERAVRSHAFRRFVDACYGVVTIIQPSSVRNDPEAIPLHRVWIIRAAPIRSTAHLPSPVDSDECVLLHLISCCGKQAALLHWSITEAFVRMHLRTSTSRWHPQYSRASPSINSQPSRSSVRRA